MSGQSLEHLGCENQQASGDADVLIVQTTVHTAMYCETTLVGDEEEDYCEVFFKPEIRSIKKKGQLCWNIKKVQ